MPTLGEGTGSATTTAEAFGAEISIADHGQTLYYVVARSGTPDAAVRSVGGEVITRLMSANQVLALAPLSAHAALRSHPELKLAGPVNIDKKRFQQFTRLIGMTELSSAQHPIKNPSNGDNP